MMRSIAFNPALSLLSLLIIFQSCGPSTSEQQVEDLIFTVADGPMEITVTGTGELNAKKSVKIRAPQGMRPAGIYETTLSNLVPEGTIVNEGDFVASLDRTELAGKMSNVQTELDKVQTQLEQAKIDTAIDLRALRDEIVNLDFTKKQKLLEVEQSKYEPQSVIQRAELDLEQTERDYKQLLTKYELKQQQAVAKIEEINALLRQNQRQLQKYLDLSNDFNIFAPKTGMVIYARTWNGKKEPGSRISAWDPVVAELPDLTDMISKTFVNEVDISKVQVGQDVTIKVDAFPDRKYTGSVLKVANIGEQLRGYDAKVFEVIVQVNEVDSIMRPAMTTSNEIVTNVLETVTHIPLEALFSDSLSFVYKRDGNSLVRQEVITGLSNDDMIVVEHGLGAGETIYLTEPNNKSSLTFIPIDPSIKDEIRQKQEEAKRAREAQAMERRKKMEGVDMPSPSSDGGGGGIIIIN
ncbi:MAG: efflux RND transporter periplasmic adaptor subunit [Saprospiraceae bacterium]|nr:efflux RND transporter periplasmic adaptor subunit [Saprospiraceae bacterium]